MPATFEQIFFALAIRQKLMTSPQAQALIALMKEGTPEEVKALAVKAGLKPDAVEAMGQQAQKLVEKFAAEKDAKLTELPAPSAAPAKPASPQEVIPGYKFMSKLGVGGTATVFLAETPKGKCAVKILHPKKAAEPKQRERFMREARLLTEFDHPNIVKGRDFGTHNALFFFAMEYIEGVTVQEMLDKSGAIEQTRALEIIVDVARGLDYVHAKGYVHKDIKPGNIMITRDGRVKLCDLGFANTMIKSNPETSVDRLAETDADLPAQPDEELTVGTVQFMSPEQAQGKRDLDVRSDIYSLGATLFYMVMGELPFKGETDVEQMAAHVMEELDSAGIKDKHISQHMHYFIERMMSKDRDLRYATPAALIEDITQQIEGFKRVQNAQRSVRHDSATLRKTSMLKTGEADKPAKPPEKAKEETPSPPAPAPHPPVLPAPRSLTRPAAPPKRFSALGDLRDKYRKKPKR